jgi:hypothetical protein
VDVVKIILTHKLKEEEIWDNNLQDWNAKMKGNKAMIRIAILDLG